MRKSLICIHHAQGYILLRKTILEKAINCKKPAVSYLKSSRGPSSSGRFPYSSRFFDQTISPNYNKLIFVEALRLIGRFRGKSGNFLETFWSLEKETINCKSRFLSRSPESWNLAREKASSPESFWSCQKVSGLVRCFFFIDPRLKRLSLDAFRDSFPRIIAKPIKKLKTKLSWLDPQVQKVKSRKFAKPLY